MLIMPEYCDNMTLSSIGVIDIMNGNSIISLAMIYALWQSNKNDLLDLIRPFIVYSVGNTTKADKKIDIGRVVDYMKSEFGYNSFQPEIVRRVLRRELSSKTIIQKNNEFYLVGSYQAQIDLFNKKRIDCKEHSDRVACELAQYFNNNKVKGRQNYSQKDAEVLLLAFFEKQGGSVILSVDSLRQIVYRDNEINFYIGHFILKAKEENSVLFDYLIELVKGYFVTTAVYLQAENRNVTSALFRDAVFFLDTRILLCYLGYKTKEENESVKETIDGLLKHGAKAAYFEYNEREVYNILEAYKRSEVFNISSFYTLEHFDTVGNCASIVDFEQKHFASYLSEKGIKCFSFADALSNRAEDDFRGALNAENLKNEVIAIKPSYNTDSIDDDIDAIDSVSRIRQGKKLLKIEECKAVFVTANTVLIAATKQHLKKEKLDFGFPLVISGEDLCVIAWLKDFGQDNRLPQMRLLENVLAAISPSQELLNVYFQNLNNMKERAIITEDDVKLLQIDFFARKELMEQTHGVADNISDDVIETIKAKMARDSYEKGRKDASEEAERIALEKEHSAKEQLERRKNDACKKAEEEVETEYKAKEKKALIAYRVLSCLVALIFLIATVISICMQGNTVLIVASSVVAVVTIIQSFSSILKKSTWITKRIHYCYEIRKNNAMDERKRKYLSIADPNNTSAGN